MVDLTLPSSPEALADALWEHVALLYDQLAEARLDATSLDAGLRGR